MKAAGLVVVGTGWQWRQQTLQVQGHRNSRVALVSLSSFRKVA